MKIRESVSDARNEYDVIHHSVLALWTTADDLELLILQTVSLLITWDFYGIPSGVTAIQRDYGQLIHSSTMFLQKYRAYVTSSSSIRHL
jgi:hypothetical protein